MTPQPPAPIDLDRVVDWRRVPGAERSSTAAERLAALCAHYRRRTTPRHHFDADDLAPAAAWLREVHPDAEAAFLNEAEAVRTAPEEAPSWRSGRHYWLRPLVYAYVLTGETRYVAAGLSHLRLWTHTAPQYRDPYERSQRFNGLTNAKGGLTLAYFFAATRRAPAWTDAEMAWFLAFLWETMAATENHPPLPWHNIYFSTLVARHVFALYFGEFGAAAAWEKETLARIEDCAAQHLRPDGSNVEQSPNYHRVVMNGLATVVMERRRNGLPVPECALRNIEGMTRFLQGLQTPNRRLPPLGDSSPLAESPPLLFLPSLCLGSARLCGARPSAEQCLYLPTAEARACLSRPEAPAPPKDAAFPDAGYYVMRSSWAVDAAYLVFDAGPHGYYHGHEDLFSIHLMVGERALVVDPGGILHLTPAARGVRSTPFHNTISLDLLSHRVFEDETERLARVTQWAPLEDGGVFLSAHHTAYDHLWGRPTVFRQVFFDGRSLFVIVDRVVCAEPGLGRRPHALISNFNLPDREHVEARPDLGWARTTFPDGPNMYLACANRDRMHLVGLHDGLLVGKGGLQDTSRFAVCDNGDRTWAAFVLSAAPGPAVAVGLRAEGEADGLIRVEVPAAEGAIRLDFLPTEIRFPAAC